jgi:hypothetical protein
MAIDLTKMTVAYNGQPFIEVGVGDLQLSNMNVAYLSQPFVRGATILENPYHKLIFSGSSIGPKLKLLGHGTNRKLKIV